MLVTESQHDFLIPTFAQISDHNTAIPISQHLIENNNRNNNNIEPNNPGDSHPPGGAYSFSIAAVDDNNRNEFDISSVELHPLLDISRCEHVYFLRNFARHVTLHKAQSLLIQYVTAPTGFGCLLVTIFLFCPLVIWLTVVTMDPSVSLLWIVGATLLMIYRFVYLRRKRNKQIDSLGPDVTMNRNQFNRNNEMEPVKVRSGCSIFYCQPKYEIVTEPNNDNNNNFHEEGGLSPQEIIHYNKLAARLVESGLSVNIGLCICVYCTIFAVLFIVFGFKSGFSIFSNTNSVLTYLLFYGAVGIVYSSCVCGACVLFCCVGRCILIHSAIKKNYIKI